MTFDPLFNFTFSFFAAPPPPRAHSCMTTFFENKTDCCCCCSFVCIAAFSSCYFQFFLCIFCWKLFEIEEVMRRNFMQFLIFISIDLKLKFFFRQIADFEISRSLPTA